MEQKRHDRNAARAAILEKHPLRKERPFCGGQSKKKKHFLRLPVIYIKNTTCKKMVQIDHSCPRECRKQSTTPYRGFRALHFQSRSQRNIVQQYTNGSDPQPLPYSINLFAFVTDFRGNLAFGKDSGGTFTMDYEDILKLIKVPIRDSFS